MNREQAKERLIELAGRDVERARSHLLSATGDRGYFVSFDYSTKPQDYHDNNRSGLEIAERHIAKVRQAADELAAAEYVVEVARSI